MPNHLRLAATLGFAATLLALVVHGAATSPPSPCGDTGRLTVLGGKDDSGTRRALIAGWQAPDGTTARFSELPTNTDLEHSELIATARSRTCAADVYIVDTPRIPEFAEAGYIDPVGVPGDGLAGILPEVLATGRYEGEMWAVPLNTDAPLLIYRKDLVTKVPRTRAELMAEARSLAARPRSPVKSGLLLQLDRYEGFTVNILELIRENGGDITTDEDGKVTMDRAAVLGTLKELAAAMRGDRPAVSPASLNADEIAGIDAFERGEAAFLRDWPAFYTLLLTDLATLKPEQIGAVPYPGERVLGGQSLAVAASLPGDRARAARDLIGYLTGERQQQRLFACGGWAPVRADVYESGAGECQIQGTRHKRLVLHADAKAIKEAVMGARARPPSVHYMEFSRVLQQHLRERVRCAALAVCPAAADDDAFLDRLAGDLERAARGRGR